MPGMLSRLLALLRSLVSALQTHQSLALENLALRQQLAALKQKSPRPQLSSWDRLFWVALRSLWSDWRSALHIVQPATVIRWQRAGFRLLWRWKSRRRPGRPEQHEEARALARRMAGENLSLAITPSSAPGDAPTGESAEWGPDLSPVQSEAELPQPPE
jgi:hypothetical protein